MNVTIVEDLVDEFTWTRIETSVDDDGLTEYRLTEYDDGTVTFEDFDAGVLRLVEQRDEGPGGSPSDARPWQVIQTYFDTNGQIESRFQHNDNGIMVFTEYEDGVRRRHEQVDLGPSGSPSDVKPWERIETFYDTNGVIEARHQVNDDGTKVLTQYENGVRIRKEQIDLTSTGDTSDVKPWERIETYYDANGVIEGKSQVNDDGRVIAILYENGSAITRIVRDTDGMGNSSDLWDWDRIIIDYDPEGRVAARSTEYDDGDITAVLFEDGNRAFKFELDGDDSEDWVSRETIYNPDGSIAAVNTYDYDIFNQTPAF